MKGEFSKPERREDKSEEVPELPQPGALIGEPIQRPDGRVVTCYKDTTGIEIRVGGLLSFYDDDTVHLLGDGDWYKGVFLLHSASYEEDEKTVVGGSLRAMEDVIERLQQEDQ